MKQESSIFDTDLNVPQRITRSSVPGVINLGSSIVKINYVDVRGFDSKQFRSVYSKVKVEDSMFMDILCDVFDPSLLQPQNPVSIFL